LQSLTALVTATRADVDQQPLALLKADGTPLVRRIVEQLTTLRVTVVHVLGRPEHAEALTAALADLPVRLHVHAGATVTDDLVNAAQVLAAATGPTVVVGGDVYTQREALAGLIADPRSSSGILTTGQWSRGRLSARIRSTRGRVISAETPVHECSRSTSYFLSVMRVNADDASRLAVAAKELAALLADKPSTWEHARQLQSGLVRRRVQRFVFNERLADVPEGDERRAVLELTPEELDALPPDADVLDRLSRLQHMAEGDALTWLLLGLVRTSPMVTNNSLRALYWRRPVSKAELDVAVEEIEDFDEERVLLESAVKGSDGFFTTFFVSPYSKYIARWAGWRGISPNTVTVFSMALGILAATGFALGTRPGLIAGAVLLQLAFTFDCVDGQLARYTRQFSTMGAWLDSVFDRGKEYVVYVGLAWGSIRGFDQDVWGLAVAALMLQCLRHFIDFSYAASFHQSIAMSAQPPLSDPADVVLASDAVEPDHGESARSGLGAGEPVKASLGSRAIQLSRWAERWEGTRWAKRIVVLPIGERFALISLTAAFGRPHLTFLALLVWGGLAGAYTATGRVLRSLA